MQGDRGKKEKSPILCWRPSDTVKEVHSLSAILYSCMLLSAEPLSRLETLGSARHNQPTQSSDNRGEKRGLAGASEKVQDCSRVSLCSPETSCAVWRCFCYCLSGCLYVGSFTGEKNPPGRFLMKDLKVHEISWSTSGFRSLSLFVPCRCVRCKYHETNTQVRLMPRSASVMVCPPLELQRGARVEQRYMRWRDELTLTNPLLSFTSFHCSPRLMLHILYDNTTLMLAKFLVSIVWVSQRLMIPD